MQLSCDCTPLALVAYANVVGGDGTSPLVNSGVQTARVGAGQYTVTLPGGPAIGGGVVPGPTEGLANTMIIVEPRASAAIPMSAVAYSTRVDDSDPFVKRIFISAGAPIGTLADSDFTVHIWRTTKPPSQPGQPVIPT